jgi:cardiolipin synthase A/B
LCFVIWNLNKALCAVSEEDGNMFLFIDIIFFLYYIYIIAAAVFLIMDNRRTASTFAWLFVFIIFPVVGMGAYILFGKNHRIIGKKRKKIESKIIKYFSGFLDSSEAAHKSIKDKMQFSKTFIFRKKLINLLEQNSYALLTANNNVEIIQEGKRKFSQLMEDLQGAESSIHMAYFIWRDDEMTGRIKNILINKAGEGIEVRILVDALGSIRLPKKYKNELRQAGVRIYRYFDFGSLFSLHTVNYRNHRKIVVVDGYIGYTGGMNMGKEYIDGEFGYNCWRDTHVRIIGEGVKFLQAIFVLEWKNTTREKILGIKYFPEVREKIGEAKMQIAFSGPDSQWSSVKQMYFEMICSARKTIIIQSPYFVPDETLMDALKTASLSGIDIKIMLTGVADKKLPYWTAYTFFEELLEAGVRIFHYNRCFLHSKTIAVDSEISSIGTANFDIRSFDINYELMVVFYDRKLSAELEKDFNADLKECSEMTQEIYDQIEPLRRFRNSAARLMSPLL